jgi:Holliday junction DNA helicase RuvA
MFYSIRGKLIGKSETSAVIETGGISYELLIPSNAYQNLPEIGEEAILYSILIVRENEMYLVGLASLEDKRLYETLITVSGIGPKQGLRILSDLSASEIRTAIVTGDSVRLSSVKGIGTKTASRIILELKDKMKTLPEGVEYKSVSQAGKKRLEVLMAMRVLGFSDTDVKEAIDKIFNIPEYAEKDIEEIIKAVLSAKAK